MNDSQIFRSSDCNNRFQFNSQVGKKRLSIGIRLQGLSKLRAKRPLKQSKDKGSTCTSSLTPPNNNKNYPEQLSHDTYSQNSQQSIESQEELIERVSLDIEAFEDNYQSLMEYLANEMNINYKPSLRLKLDNGWIVRKVKHVQDMDVFTIIAREKTGSLQSQMESQNQAKPIDMIEEDYIQNEKQQQSKDSKCRQNVDKSSKNSSKQKTHQRAPQNKQKLQITILKESIKSKEKGSQKDSSLIELLSSQDEEELSPIHHQFPLKNIGKSMQSISLLNSQVLTNLNDKSQESTNIEKALFREIEQDKKAASSLMNQLASESSIQKDKSINVQVKEPISSSSNKNDEQSFQKKPSFISQIQRDQSKEKASKSMQQPDQVNKSSEQNSELNLNSSVSINLSNQNHGSLSILQNKQKSQKQSDVQKEKLNLIPNPMQVIDTESSSYLRVQGKTQKLVQEANEFLCQISKEEFSQSINNFNARESQMSNFNTSFQQLSEFPLIQFSEIPQMPNDSEFNNYQQDNTVNNEMQQSQQQQAEKQKLDLTDRNSRIPLGRFLFESSGSEQSDYIQNSQNHSQFQNLNQINQIPSQQVYFSNQNLPKHVQQQNQGKVDLQLQEELQNFANQYLQDSNLIQQSAHNSKKRNSKQKESKSKSKSKSFIDDQDLHQTQKKSSKRRRNQKENLKKMQKVQEKNKKRQIEKELSSSESSTPPNMQQLQKYQ
eukprot:403352812